MKNRVFYFFLWFSMAASLIAQAEPLVQEKIETYDIEGATKKEILNSINQRGIEEKDGTICAAHTDWQVRWNIQYFPKGDDACGLTSFKITVDVQYLYPKWDMPGADSRLKEEWLKFLSHVHDHEKGHRDLAVQAAREIESSFSAIGIYGNCKELELAANGIGREIIRKYRHLEREYDEKTEHGKTQGATF